MQALYILPKGTALVGWVQNVPTLNVATLSPTLLSAFTAMRIAKTLDSQPIDIVVAYNVNDAMAAISARKIARNKPKIAVELNEAAIPAHGIASDLKENVDAWLCATERTQQLIAERLGENARLSPATIWQDTPTVPVGNWEYKEPANKNIYLWVGSIDKNTQRLREAIEMANACPQNITLRIWGTGKAQLVMPLVRLSRGIENPTRIEWVGDSSTLDNALEDAYRLVQSGQEPEQLELELGRRGMPIIQPADVGLIDAPTLPCPSESQLADELLQTYNSFR